MAIKILSVDDELDLEILLTQYAGNGRTYVTHKD